MAAKRTTKDGFDEDKPIFPDVKQEPDDDIFEESVQDVLREAHRIADESQQLKFAFVGESQQEGLEENPRYRFDTLDEPENENTHESSKEFGTCRSRRARSIRGNAIARKP